MHTKNLFYVIANLSQKYGPFHVKMEYCNMQIDKLLKIVCVKEGTLILRQDVNMLNI